MLHLGSGFYFIRGGDNSVSLYDVRNQTYVWKEYLQNTWLNPYALELLDDVDGDGLKDAKARIWNDDFIETGIPRHSVECRSSF